MTSPARLSPCLALSAARFAPALLAVAAVLAAPTASAQLVEGVPFKADVTVQETLRLPRPDDTLKCPVLIGMTNGQGTASHLGAVRLAASDCVVPTDGGFAFFNGTFTFTAANGDMLIGSYATSGPVVLQPTMPNSNVLTLSTPYVIISGTGRFSRATGAGTLSGTLRLAGVPTGAPPGVVGIAEGQYQADGRISY